MLYLRYAPIIQTPLLEISWSPALGRDLSVRNLGDRFLFLVGSVHLLTGK